jgi:alkylation response protein AidB-like acyl-CoA dehydrogenase
MQRHEGAGGVDARPALADPSQLAAFREVVRKFLQAEVIPYYEDWESGEVVPREFWRKAGALGFFGMQVPEEFGGVGRVSFRFNAAITEEAQAAGVGMGAFRLQSDVCIPYFLHVADDEQRARYLAGLTAGELICAIAMTEPDAGSDLRGIRTSAIRGAGHFVLNGSKTFISNATIADVVIVVAKVDPERGKDAGLTLFLVDRDMPGVSSGRPFKKLGLHAHDTGELFFHDVRVPAAHVLGEVDAGLSYLTSNLSQERLSIAVSAQASAEAALRRTVDFAKSRRMFSTTLAKFQNTKFELAACATDVAAGRALVEEAMTAFDGQTLTPAAAAMAKLFCSEMQGRVVDRCLQLHGGAGYMSESRIGRAYSDARVTRIYGGSSEVMKIVIARSLGL